MCVQGEGSFEQDDSGPQNSQSLGSLVCVILTAGLAAMLASLDLLLETFLEPHTGTPLPGSLDSSSLCWKQITSEGGVPQGQLGSWGEGLIPPQRLRTGACFGGQDPGKRRGRSWGSSTVAGERQRHLLVSQLFSSPC